MLSLLLYIPRDQKTATGLCRSNYRDRQSAMQFILDTHYPRIASFKLELAVCGSLCAYAQTSPTWGLGLVGSNDGIKEERSCGEHCL